MVQVHKVQLYNFKKSHIINHLGVGTTPPYLIFWIKKNEIEDILYPDSRENTETGWIATELNLNYIRIIEVQKLTENPQRTLDIRIQKDLNLK